MSHEARLPVIAVFAIGIIAALSIALNNIASAAEPKTVDVQLGNSTFQLSYNMSNGGFIERAEAETHQPYGGALILYPSSTADGLLELTMPREFFDIVGFTDHFEEGLAIIVDEVALDYAPSTSSRCDRIVVQVPIAARSEQIGLVVGDILGVHTHSYPPALHVTKEIAADGSEFNVHMWTTATKCDISFSKEEKKLHLDIEERNATSQGSLSIAIPPQLLGGNYTVLADSNKINFTVQQPYIEYIGSSSENTVLTRLRFNYPADTKTLDIIGTSVLDPNSAFEAFALFYDVHGTNYMIDGKAQAGIDIVNSTIIPSVGIFINLNTTAGGALELTLSKNIVENVTLVEVSHSDVQEAVRFDIVAESDFQTTIRFNVMDGAQQVTIKGAGGVVPEFGLVLIPVLLASVIAVMVGHSRIRK